MCTQPEQQATIPLYHLTGKAEETAYIYFYHFSLATGSFFFFFCIGKTFDGWSVNGKKYAAGAVLNATESVTAVATWRDLGTEERIVVNKPSVNAKDLEGKKELVFNVNGNEILYDEKSLQSIKNQCKPDSVVTVELKAVTKETAGLNEEQLQALENETIDGLYTISLNVDGNEVDYFYGGSTVIRVNYNKKYEHSKFHVYRVEAWGSMNEVDSYYQDGQVNWVTGSHSCYLIQEEEDKDFVPEPDKDSDKEPEKEDKEDKEDKESEKEDAKTDTNTSVATSLKLFASMMVVSLLGMLVLAKKRS